MFSNNNVWEGTEGQKISVYMKKSLLFILMMVLVLDNLSAATYYYAKVTASDGTVSWLRIDRETLKPDWSQSSIKGAVDLDEVWTEYGGTGTKRTIYTIPSGAFINYTGITSVKGSSVTTLKNQAFLYCSSLTTVNFPNLEEIEEHAFAYCSALVSYSIPASVTSIDGSAFYHSTSLTNLTVNTSNYYYSVENNILYNKNKTTLVAFLSSRNDLSYVVPSTVMTIGSQAFMYNWYLKSVIISNGVKTINRSAFYSCSKLQSVFIPQSVSSIGSSAFSGCNSLTSVKVANPNPINLTASIYPNTTTLYVPVGSKSAYENANYWNEAAEIIEYIPSPVIDFADATVKDICVSNWDYDGDGELSEEEALEVEVIGTQFQGKATITSFDELKYFTNLKTIAASAFSECTSLSSIQVPASVTYIGYNAFLNTPFLNAQSDGLIYIGNVLYAYRGTMPENTTIVIKDGTTCICDYAFSNYSTLVDIDLPNSLIHIGEYAFNNCKGLTTIKVPSGVKEIVRYAFYGSGLTSVELPEGLESIGNSSFRSCTALESIVIPDRVTAIGKNTFRECSQLKSVTMPYYLQSVKTDAFRACNKLEAVFITNLGAWCNIDFEDYRANPLTYAHHLYVNNQEINDLVLPTEQYNGSGYWDGKWSGSYYYEMNTVKNLVFNGCSLQSVVIPENIKSVGANAFGSCNDLKAVIMKSSPFTLTSNAFPTRTNVSLYVLAYYVDNYNNADVWSTFKEIKTYPNADVNSDEDKDVLDVVDMVRYLNGNPSEAFDRFVADFNSDGKVDETDLDNVLSRVSSSPSLNELIPDVEQKNKIKVENVILKPRQNCTVDIILDNLSEDLVGFQMDITLPTGVDVNTNGCLISDRIADEEQQLYIRKLTNTTYRLFSTSLSLLPITGKTGKIATISLSDTNSGTATMTISNVRFVTSNSKRLVLENIDFEIPPLEYIAFSEGDGTEENPYLLYDGYDFVNIAKDVNGGINYTGTYFLVASPEIDFSGHSYTAIGTESKQFGGYFDGNGVVIKNLSATNGLFGYMSKNGTITNIIIDETCIINGTSRDAAGFVGASRGTISNCINKASVTSTKYHIGGICGDNMGTIINCKNYGDISSNYDVGMVGGIAGDIDSGKILNCENYGKVTGPACWIGGIVGLVTGNKSVIDGCLNAGDVSGTNDIGCITGSSEQTAIVTNNLVTSCTITGTYSSSHFGAGAIAPSDYYATFSNNYYTKDVIVKVGTNTYDNDTPRGIWGDSGPVDVENNNGAVMVEAFATGDADGDGVVDVNDVTSTINYILNKPTARFVQRAADVDGDTSIDVNDVQGIINIALGKDK